MELDTHWKTMVEGRRVVRGHSVPPPPLLVRQLQLYYSRGRKEGGFGDQPRVLERALGCKTCSCNFLPPLLSFSPRKPKGGVSTRLLTSHRRGACVVVFHLAVSLASPVWQFFVKKCLGCVCLIKRKLLVSLPHRSTSFRFLKLLLVLGSSSSFPHTLGSASKRTSTSLLLQYI